MIASPVRPPERDPGTPHALRGVMTKRDSKRVVVIDECHDADVAGILVEILKLELASSLTLMDQGLVVLFVGADVNVLWLMSRVRRKKKDVAPRVDDTPLDDQTNSEDDQP